MIDSHAHLTDRAYSDYNAVIKRALGVGVKKIITVGYDEQSSLNGAKIAQENDSVFFTVGIHPSECERVDNSAIEQLLPLFSQDKCLAVGEIGLDYHYEKDKTLQKELFKCQLELAVRLNLPVVIHSREATKDMLEILTEYHGRLKKGFLMHCYSESAESAKEYLKLGAYFAFGGVITFKNAKKDEIIKSIPLNRVLCETDCPYMTPVPYRGQVNEPMRVVEVYKKMAEIYGVEISDLVKTVANNTARFFNDSRLGER